MQPIETIKKAMENKRLRISAAVAGLLAVVLLSLLSLDAFASWNKVHPGVEVGGFSIGGKSKAEAEKELRSRLNKLLSADVPLIYKDQKWLLSPKQVGFEIDFDRTVERAFGVGRGRSKLESISERTMAWVRGKKSPIVFRLNRAKAAQYLVLVNEQIGKSAVDARVVFDQATPEIVKSKPGTELDWDRALNDVKAALLNLRDRKVSLRLKKAVPDITDDEAERAATKAKELISKPVTLAYEDRTWTLEAPDIASLIAFKKAESEDNFIYEVMIDKAKFSQKVDSLTADIIVQPKNAGFEVDGDIVRVVPGEKGRKIDSGDAYGKLMEAMKDGKRKVSLSMVDMEPDLTTEEAKSYGIERKLASFTTYYSPTPARVNNIHLIADSIDGAIVDPGEVFSVNEHVGPRTAEKGYQEAPVIVNGKLVPGLGGGICQATTALFNAVYDSGLEIVERTNHAFYISRYPAGRDATVSYGSLDMRFKNDTGYRILIKFWYTSDSLTAAIYGKDGLNTEVQSTSTPFTNYRGFQTTEKPDPTLPKGQRVVEQEGVMGRDITVYRTVKRNGKIIHEDTFFSRYDPEPAIVRVGTKEEPPPEQPSAENPSPEKPN